MYRYPTREVIESYSNEDEDSESATEDTTTTTTKMTPKVATATTKHQEHSPIAGRLRSKLEGNEKPTDPPFPT